MCNQCKKQKQSPTDNHVGLVSGKFTVRCNQDGQYRLDFSLFDYGFTCREKIQARQIMLQTLLLDLLQAQSSLSAGSVRVHKAARVGSVDLKLKAVLRDQE